MKVSSFINSEFSPTAQYYNQIVDSLQEYSIFTVNSALKINSWNAGAANIFQYDKDEVMGKSFDIIFQDEDVLNKIPQSDIITALTHGRAVDNRMYKRKDGTAFFAYGLVFPLLDDNGKILGYVKILRDLTDSKKSEDAINKYINDLEELNAHKENIIAILSHDLRSPLARIISLTQYLMKNFDTMQESEIKQFLNVLHTESRDELNMLDYLVEWARIKYASQVFTPEKLNLFEKVNKVCKKLNQSLTARAVIIINKVDENCLVYADRKMLMSILQNLLTNAVSHSNPSGVITVSAIEKDEEIIVEVKDNGSGMSEQRMNSLFIPNISALVKERKDNKGAGIGLLITKSFVEANSGKIWVSSEEGKGTSFYFSLPLNEPVVKEMEDPNPDFPDFIIPK